MIAYVNKLSSLQKIFNDPLLTFQFFSKKKDGFSLGFYSLLLIETNTVMILLLLLGFKHVLAVLSKKSSNSYMSSEMLSFGNGVNVSQVGVPGGIIFS